MWLGAAFLYLRENEVPAATSHGNAKCGQQSATAQEGQGTSAQEEEEERTAPAANVTRAISGNALAILGAASVAVAGILMAERNKNDKCVSATGNKKCNR